MEKFTTIKDKVMRIWTSAKDDKIIYKTSISRKLQDGKYENWYIIVQLPKDRVVSNGQDIFVKNGFWTYWKNSNGFASPKIVITDFDILGEQALEDDVFKDMGITDEELDYPF